MIVNIDGAKRIEIAWAFFHHFLTISPKKNTKKIVNTYYISNQKTYISRRVFFFFPIL
jgi:hypothetical protein